MWAKAYASTIFAAVRRMANTKAPDPAVKLLKILKMSFIVLSSLQATLKL